MNFIVLFTLFSQPILPLIIHESVAFHRANEIVLTRFKWLSTFVIDLKPYENFFNRLSEDLGKAKMTAHSIEQFYYFPSKQDCGRIIKGLKGETVALLNDQHTQVENYTELHAIHTKMKRLLIPIMDKGLSYLFGTATESDLNTIHTLVSRVARSEEMIAHVVDENILVINITKVEMLEKRQASNKIIGSLANVDVKLGSIVQALGKEVFQVGQSVQLYLLLDSVMQTI